MSTTEKKIQHSICTELKQQYLVITWNMANQLATADDITQLLQAKRWGTFIANLTGIIVVSQEETRQAKQGLAHKISERLGGIVHTQKFNTFTKGKSTWDTLTGGAKGRVSLSLITNHKVTFAHQGKFAHRNGKPKFCANKGGVFSQFRISGQRINVVAAHLESKKDAIKNYETQQLMQGIEGGLGNKPLSFEDICSRAADLDIFAGDLNYRHIYTQDKTTHQIIPIDPFHAQKKEHKAQQHFDMHQFTPSSVAGSPLSYAGDLDKGNGHDAKNKSKRKVGGTKSDAGTSLHYCQGGMLDRVLYRAANQQSVKDLGSHVISSINTSDHKPVLSLIEVATTPAENQQTQNFTRTQHWVSKIITGIASDKVIAQVKQQKNDSNGKQYIAACYNYYARVKELKLQGENLRLRNYHKVSKAINGAGGLAEKFAEHGDVFFMSTAPLSNEIAKNQLDNNLVKSAAAAIIKEPELKKHRSLWGKFINAIKSLFCYIKKTTTQKKISSVSTAMVGIFKGKTKAPYTAARPDVTHMAIHAAANR